MLRLLLLTLIFIHHFVSAQLTSTYLLGKLSEAEDYLRVHPSIASKILKNDLASIAQLSLDEQLNWHQNLLRASIAINDLQQVESTIRIMLSYPNLEQNIDEFVSMLSALGIFLRRKGHPEESIWLFNCGLKYVVKNEKQKVSLLISKGNSLSYLNKYSQAKTTYLYALQSAIEINDDVSISAIYNTLGIMAIEEGDYALAKKYLMKALQLSQKISRRSGQIVAGLHLLRLSILNAEPMLYERLYYRISRLILASDNKIRHEYLFWIEKAHKVSKGGKLSSQEQKVLLNKLEQIKLTSVGVYNQLVEKLAKPMGIKSLPIAKEYSVYQGNLLDHIYQCEALIN